MDRYGQHLAEPGSAAKMDLIERYSSISDAMPALGILSILGILFAAKRGPSRTILALLAAAFAAGCLILSNAYISYRYLHDFYPFLVIAAVLGVGALSSISKKPLRLTVKVLIALAAVWSIAANFAFALKWQREDFWPDPAPRAAFLHARSRIDALLLRGKREPIKYHIGDELEYFDPGQLLNVVDPPATYRYDGKRWDYLSGVPLHRFHLLVKFPRGVSLTRMPLWFAGRSGASDAVYLEYLEPTEIHFCFDHWGNGGPCGPTTAIDPGREYHIQIDADRLNSALTVLLDGKNVLEVPTPFHVWNDGEVRLGKSLAPSAHGAEFTGEIRPDTGAK